MEKTIEQAIREVTGATDAEKFVQMNETAYKVAVKVYELTCLKKQNSQKPAEWSEEDEALLKEIVSFFKDGTVKLQHDLDLYARFLENKLKSLRPSWKPSEEQMEVLAKIVKYPYEAERLYVHNTLEELIDDLKKL